MAVVINGIQAYPLLWPLAIPRAKSRNRSLFKTTMDKARNGLLVELGRMGCSDAVISSNIKPRADGSPGSAEPGDPGVAVYFKRKGKPLVFACDRYWYVRENLHALKLTIEALRGIERWGTAEMMDQAFTGFTALPASTEGESWWSVLGCDAFASPEHIEAAYRRQLRVVHPDVPGGSHEAMQKLNLARDQAKAVQR